MKPSTIVTPIRAALVCAALLATGAAQAADSVTETRAIDARIVKVRLDGVIDVKIKQGPTAGLTLYGDKGRVAKVTAVQSGDTLIINTEKENGIHIGRNALRAELTLPALREVVSAGVGSSDVSGFTGNEVDLVLDGAGSFKVSSQYKSVNVRLGGLGSMTLDALNADRIDLNMRGAGRLEVNGQSKVLNAQMGGLGSLDADNLRSDSVRLDMSGMGSASVYAVASANLNLSGLGSATVYGNPAKRESSSRGMGSISWKQ